MEILKVEGFSADNIAFGMGGGLLQQPNRDDFRFAIKASAICVDGEWRDVYKE
ncbi:Nicotinamide phosphoribosyltransferase [hydrothermal vent metagenome]|uniref:Nicotinamide phosphoribosyltransferase n=1 Tax=hydrothermal vent metagenome TaxID=652676 RepID=A0A1W1D187_9ZZZZ